jgi:hypothetical protein
MFVVELADQLFDIKFFAQAGVKFADADFNGGAEPIRLRDALAKLAAELFLRSLRQRHHRQLQALTIFINDIPFLCLAAGLPGPIG